MALPCNHLEWVSLKNMMRIASILLSALLLLQSLHLAIPDLAQLDELMEHARYHREQFGDSLLTFLAKHYGDQKMEHQQDHSEHEQLPFQHSTPHFLTHSHYFMVLRFAWKGLPEYQEGQRHHYYYQLPAPGLFENGVFQPPRHS